MPVVIFESVDPTDASVVTKVTVTAVGEANRPVLTATGAIVTPKTDHTDSVTGELSLTLLGNSTLLPDGNLYKVEYLGRGERKPKVDYIEVPAAGGPYRARDLITDPPADLESSALSLHKLSVADHADVDLTGNATGKVLMWDGTNFVPADTVATDVEAASLVAAEAVLRSDADDALQTDIDSKETPAGAQAKVDAALQVVAANTQTDDYTLVLADAGKAVDMDKATAVNLTVPPDASVAFEVGTVIEVTQLGAGQVTVVEGFGVTINSPSGWLRLAEQFSAATLRKLAADEWLLVGDLTA